MLIVTGFFVYRIEIKNIWLNLTKPNLPPAEIFQNNKETKLDDTNSNNVIQTTVDENVANVGSKNTLAVTIPVSYNLNVPFTSQAPKEIWNETFKEGCEEAVALMVYYFYENRQEITAETVEKDILQMVAWQKKNFGGHFDLTASQTAQMIQEYFGYKKVEIINQPSIEEIKYHLVNQRPVIIPTAGQVLGNPYYRQPGPIYHMLVIKGYTENEFITNDPGTKRGHDFLYSPQTIFNAMHDWLEKNILEGDKKIIVIYPN